jgi:hypothetical protein
MYKYQLLVRAMIQVEKTMLNLTSIFAIEMKINKYSNKLAAT